MQARVPVTRSLTSWASGSYTGAQFCLDPQLQREVRLDGSGRLDLGLAKRWEGARGGLARLSTGVHLDNATDAASYDQCGLPQPGRTLRLTAEVAL